MTHVGVEQPWAGDESGESILRTVELPGHGHHIDIPGMVERPKIRPPRRPGLNVRGKAPSAIDAAEDLRPCLEAKAIRRRGHTRDLFIEPVEAVVIHHNPPLGLVHTDVW